MSVPGYSQRLPVAGTAANVVAMRGKEWKVFDTGIAQTAKARLQATMETYCTLGPMPLPDSLFRFLEHYEGSGAKVRLEEFKARAVRLFGFRADDMGQPTFFVTGSDVAKKGNKANPVLVDLAGREAVRIVGVLRKQAAGMKGKGR